MATNVILLANVARHLAKTGRLEPHQEQAMQFLDEELAKIPEAVQALEETTKRWRQPPTVELRDGAMLIMRPTGRRIQVSRQWFIEFKVRNQNTKESVTVISGGPSAQVLDHPSRDWAGSNRPIPEGIYRIGAVEVAPQASWGPGLGKLWMSLEVEPRYRLNNRSGFGIHLDANVGNSPGSAGCVVSPSQQVIDKLVQWRRAGATRLVVDYNFGIVTASPQPRRYEITPVRKRWLDTIAWAEGTSGTNGYRMIFTGKLFDNGYRDHPRQLQSGGGWTSDAAGRYQFLSTTWDDVRHAMQLPDFSPESQDQAALWLIDVKRGVLSALDSHQWLRVLDSISWEWASLPASTGRSRYGQPTKSIDEIRRRLMID